MELATSAASARSLTTVAFERLRADILCGDLKPSERLRIQSLSERYDVGATAIREALSRLTADGTVVSEDLRGFCVAPVSREELEDLTSTRISVEQMALRASIAKGDVEWESRIVSSFHRLSRTPLTDDPQARAHWASVHRDFHESLVAGCGSPWTLRLCQMLGEKSLRYLNLSSRMTGPHERDVHSEHRNLMEAVIARDAERACDLIAEHFRMTTRVILQFYAASSKIP